MLYGLLNSGISFKPETDIPDLAGKVIFITGGNVGLGKESILQLSKHNPTHIYLAARTESKSLSAIEDVKKIVPDATISFLTCDLTSLPSVASCAKEFLQREKKLDILMLNAGIMACPPGLTEQGYEIQFGTNHVGHALLTKLLMPTILATAAQPGGDVRVVSLASIGHLGAPSAGISFPDLKTDMASFSTVTRYGQSKLANILFAKELARRYPTLTAVSLHPGVVNTELYRSVSGWWGIGRLVSAVQHSMYTSVQDGAKNQLWAATAPLGEVGKGVKSGDYYTPVGVTGQGSRKTKDEELAGKLWEWTEKELERYTL